MFVILRIDLIPCYTIDCHINFRFDSIQGFSHYVNNKRRDIIFHVHI